jgi:hypothetical protein
VWTYPRYSTPLVSIAPAQVFGGVYIDLDVAPCPSFDSILRGGKENLLLVRDPKHVVSNYFMASVRNHSFWPFAIGALPAASRRASRQELRKYAVDARAGPLFFHRTWRRFERTHGVPRDQRSAENCTDSAPERCLAVLPHAVWQRSFAVHWWMSLWHRKPPYEGLVIVDDALLLWLRVNITDGCTTLADVFREANETVVWQKRSAMTWIIHAGTPGDIEHGKRLAGWRPPRRKRRTRVHKL